MVSVEVERTEQGWRVVRECGETLSIARPIFDTVDYTVSTRWLLNHLSGLDGTHPRKERET